MSFAMIKVYFLHRKGLIVTPTPIQDLIALALVPGAGRKAIHNALQIAQRQSRPLSSYFGTPVHEILSDTATGEQSAAASLAKCSLVHQERAPYLLELTAEWEMGHWTCQSPAYPPFLAESLGTQAPPFLFYQGNEALLESTGVAIVGTRRPSLEGRDWAKKSAGLFAEEGITIVSGGAAGIDTEAHDAALRGDGTTVVVLPEGLHTYQATPSLKTGLGNGQVLLLSEFLPTAAWATPQAITRNRSIAACARMTCVIEPGKKGGSMYTAEQSLSQDKPVFFWGGACRDGFLKNESNAHPLGTRYGDLHREALIAALTPPPALHLQGDLFSE